MISIGGSSSKSSYRPTRVNVWAPGQWSTFRRLVPLIQRGMSGPAPAYPGRMYVPTTEAEQQYLWYVQGMLPDIMARSRALTRSLTQPAYEVNPQATEEFYQRGIRAPALYEFRNVTLPQVRESFVGPGFYGSARAEAEADAAERLALTLSQRRAELAYSDELARRKALTDLAQRAAGAGLGAEQLGYGQLAGAGELERTIEQERTFSQLQRWLMGEQVGGVIPWQYNPFMRLAFAVLGLNPYVVATEGRSTSGEFSIGIKI